MYDGLSKNDLRIILGFNHLTHKGWSKNEWSVSLSLQEADLYLNAVEAIHAEQERSDGEREGTRDA